MYTTTMPQDWISHVKRYAKEHKLKFGDALKKARSSYKKQSGGKRSAKKVSRRKRGGGGGRRRRSGRK